MAMMQEVGALTPVRSAICVTWSLPAYVFTSMTKRVPGVKMRSFGSRVTFVGLRLAVCARRCRSCSMTWMSLAVIVRIASMPLTAFLIALTPSEPVARRDAQILGSSEQSMPAELISASLISVSAPMSVLSKLRGSTGSLPTLTKAKKRSLYSSTSHSSPDGNATSYDGGPYLVAW